MVSNLQARQITASRPPHRPSDSRSRSSRSISASRFAVVPQYFQTVGRRKAQVVDCRRRMELRQPDRRGSASEARPVPGAHAPTRRRDPRLGRLPGRQRLHVGIETVAPRRERGMEAREPADGEQRRLGEREDAREKSGADDLGDDEHLQAEQAVPARDQPESEQLERNEDRAGDEEGNERSVGRKARDARLAPADAGQLADPRHAGLHGVPYPLFEKNPQRGQNREHAAYYGGKNVLGVSPHFYLERRKAPTLSALSSLCIPDRAPQPVG